MVSVSQGLNERGSMVSQGLNPSFIAVVFNNQIVILTEACVVMRVSSVHTVALAVRDEACIAMRFEDDTP